MSVGLFFQLLMCAVSLAIYMVGIESNSNLSVSFLVSIVGLAGNLTPTYVCCFLSEFVTHKLSAIGDHFYDCGWYRLPAKQQRLFILPIRRGQLEFRMSGLGIVECSLSVFLSVNSMFNQFHWIAIFNGRFFSSNFPYADYASNLLLLSYNARLHVKIVYFGTVKKKKQM